MIKIDVRELEDLKKNFKKFEKMLDKIMEEAIEDIALRTLRKITKRTPVDTGNLRLSWDISRAKKTSTGYQIEILNPTEYAPYVEYGHRIVAGGATIGWKEGVFMMTISEKEMEKTMDKIIQKHLDKYEGLLFE
ncbi:HK97 gp10 family phage protein [Peptoniphilus grossensis]|uniref:HK97 gp10 family phage protein n=1 Tax=Peptoniphilus grossensis TaxID=1465756 RepID=UPI0002DCE763|nr:HK97 gp10 family phage protein [Peptoniphilus grossensis]